MIRREELDKRLPELLPELRRFLRAKRCAVDDIDDTVQDAVMRAYRQADSLRDSSKLSGWLKTIAFNEYRMRFNRRKLGVFSRLADRLAEAAPAETERLWQIVDRLMQAFPESEEIDDVLVPAALHLVLEWRVEDIAAQTATKPRTLLKRLTVFKQRMRAGRLAGPPRDRERDIQLHLAFIQHLRGAASHRRRVTHERGDAAGSRRAVRGRRSPLS